MASLWKNWNALHCWWKCKTVQPLWKTVRQFLKKLNTELPYDSAIPFLGIYPKELKTGTHICTPMFIAVLFTIAKRWKQPKCPSMNVDKNNVIYTHNEFYSALKGKEIQMQAITWMNLEDIMLSEINQSQRDKYCMIRLI